MPEFDQPDARSAESRQKQATDWFHGLWQRIWTAFEVVELTSGPKTGTDCEPGKFEIRQTRRSSGDGSDAGGGSMALLRGGRIFEKAGVNVSTVFGQLSDPARKMLSARKSVPGLESDPRFWASGVSVVAHLQNPRVPAAHFNTRMFWTPRKWWFGGGTDLNPCIEFAEDTRQFHEDLEAVCNLHDPGFYPRFKEWADSYFHIRHRNRPRGVGGIFFDDLNSGDWQADFAFVRDVGTAFLEAYLPILKRRIGEPFSEADRETQLVHRGLYAEFNLVYDRGTRFGLETGHDPDAVLMSMPPIAKWH